jgi:hypothetical protein
VRFMLSPRNLQRVHQRHSTTAVMATSSIQFSRIRICSSLPLSRTGAFRHLSCSKTPFARMRESMDFHPHWVRTVHRRKVARKPSTRKIKRSLTWWGSKKKNIKRSLTWWGSSDGRWHGASSFAARPSRPSAAPPPRRAAAPRPPPPHRRRHARHQTHCRLLRRRRPRSGRHLLLRHLQLPPPPSPGSSAGGSRAHPALLAPCTLQRRPCELAIALIPTGRVARDAQQPPAAPAPAGPHAPFLSRAAHPIRLRCSWQVVAVGSTIRRGSGGRKAAKTRVAFCRSFRLRSLPRS